MPIMVTENKVTLFTITGFVQYSPLILDENLMRNRKKFIKAIIKITSL